MEHLTLDTFKEKVFDFENNKEWSFKGEKPAIIDFYADWCAPCKMVAPVLEELSTEYGENLSIYKINTEEQRELAGMFGIQSIPSLLSFRRTVSRRWRWALCRKRPSTRLSRTF